MIIFIVISFGLLIFYSSLLIYFAIGFKKTSYFNPSYKNTTPLTIIICARNEEKTISRCIASILNQDYDLTKVELILINDASKDKTVIRAEKILTQSKIDYKIISNPFQKGKKQSIDYAITFAKNELIVLRDADTFTNSTFWLQSIVDFKIENNSDLVIAPVAIAENFGVLWALQAVESNILTLLTCGSTYFKKSFLCNGANLIFTKSIFNKVNGYSSHLNIMSGDDVLFLEDVKKIKPVTINYLKCLDAIVYTYPAYSFKKLITQKIRWASKFKQNKNKLNLILAFLIFIINGVWLGCFLTGFLSNQTEIAALCFVFLKLIIDNLLLFLASSFIKTRGLKWYALPVSFVYPMYAVIVGIASVLIKPVWKK